MVFLCASNILIALNEVPNIFNRDNFGRLVPASVLCADALNSPCQEPEINFQRDKYIEKNMQTCKFQLMLRITLRACIILVLLTELMDVISTNEFETKLRYFFCAVVFSFLPFEQ